MSRVKTLILTAGIILLFSILVSVTQAAPPVQEGDQPEDQQQEGASFGETLNFNNLGTIMSGRGDTGNTDDELDDTDDGTGDDTNDDTNGDDADTGDEDNDDSDGDEGDADGDESPGETDEETDGAKQHPVASAIADYFEVEYDEIMELHEAGNGFGTITKAYYFADQIDVDPQMTPEKLLVEAHGSGWGNTLKNHGIHPGSVGNGGGQWSKNADQTDQLEPTNNTSEKDGPPEHAGPPGSAGPPGQAKKADNMIGSPSSSSSELVGQGNGNGGNNGNKDGNGGGNGHGNAGGNGNGHGKGKHGK